MDKKTELELKEAANPVRETDRLGRLVETPVNDLAAALADGLKPRFNPAEHLTKIPHKKNGVTVEDDYLEVAWRLVWMRSEHPDADILTEPIVRSEDEVWFRATITIPKEIGEGGTILGGGGSATGWARVASGGFRDQNGKDAFVERCETKALGRALASLGYGTAFVADEFSTDTGDMADLSDSPVNRGNGDSGTTPAWQAGRPPVSDSGPVQANPGPLPQTPLATPVQSARDAVIDQQPGRQFRPPAAQPAEDIGLEMQPDGRALPQPRDTVTPPGVGGSVGVIPEGIRPRASTMQKPPERPVEKARAPSQSPFASAAQLNALKALALDEKRPLFNTPEGYQQFFIAKFGHDTTELTVAEGNACLLEFRDLQKVTYGDR